MESEGVRRRKGVGASGQAGDSKGDNQHEGSGGRSASIDRTCTYLILLVTVAVASCILLVYTIPDHPFSIILMSLVDRTAHILSLTTPFYAVVLDAGSTGSRVLGFTFFHSPVTGNLVLEDELWHEIKPGKDKGIFKMTCCFITFSFRTIKFCYKPNCWSGYY